MIVADPKHTAESEKPEITARPIPILLKGLGILLILPVYVALLGIIRLLPLSSKTKRGAATGILSGVARSLLVLFRVRVQVKHREHLRTAANARLLVSNHLSSIDILILSSQIPSVFITSVELGDTALLGMLARLSGSIFVERRKPSGLKSEIEEIAQVLGEGMTVVLFPEGTTSGGDSVRPFKNSLFDAAIVSNAEIVPVCIRYTRINNEPLTPRNRDSVFYYGGVAFGKHFLRFLSLTSVDVEVVALKAIRTQPGQSRKDLAAETYQAISDAYHGENRLF